MSLRLLAMVLLAAPSGAGEAAPRPEAAPTRSAPARSATDWSALAAADIEAAFRETRDNHPGMYDPANPGFPDRLDQARAQALILARQATSAAGFDATMSRFKAVLDDGHAGAYATLPEESQPPVRWPGFVAAWRGRALYVYRSAAGGPAPGSEIVSCDGVPIRALIARQVFGFHDGGTIPGRWWSNARLVLVDDGNPFVRPPHTCVLRQGRARSRIRLAWSPAPEHYYEWRSQSINGERLPIGMVERAPGVFWIALPDFSPDDAGVAAYQALYQAVEAARPQLLKARAIVLDLRHNNGGSSNWSRFLAQRLWGKRRVEAALRDYGRRSQAWWRATPDNLAELRRFVTLLERQGDRETADLVRGFVPRFEAAIAQGERYVLEPDSPEDPAGDTAADPPELVAPVYVIVPGQCASACLDAIDQFKRFAGTRLIGAPSSADSTYMEVRSAPLPSGMAQVIIPMKVYVGRPRGNGAHYPPDIEVRDLDWSTAGFLRHIEADLGR